MHIIDIIIVSFVSIGIYDTIEGIIYVIGTIFSITLAALSISAYKNTGIKKIKYAIVAFGLFAVFLLYEYLEHTFKRSFNNPYTDIIIPSTSLAIVVLFFLAIVRKK
jgi:hypothetical protein